MADARIGIVGCAGRMGRMLVAEAQRAAGAVATAGTVRPGSAVEGTDIGELAGIGALGVAATSDPAALFAAADVAIDFSLPAATVAHARLA
ncbi:MAG: 4-hydroxy-tetrahydrodipicolinate reductase, partial [Alphaproteobacteria bacterium]